MATNIYQHNFNNVQEYNAFAKSRGIKEVEVPNEQSNSEGNEEEQVQKQDFPKSIWEVYADKDGNKNEKVDFKESGAETKKYTKQNASTLKSSLKKQDKELFKGHKKELSQYAADAWTRVSENMNKLFAGFNDIKADAKHNITSEGDAKTESKGINKNVSEGINTQTKDWGGAIESDIQTQLKTALEIAQRELKGGENGTKFNYADKDKDHSQKIELSESGIQSKDLTEGIDITQEIDAKFKNSQGVDLSSVKSNAQANLTAKADTIMKTGYENVGANIKNENLNDEVEKGITEQKKQLQNTVKNSVDGVVKDAEAEVKNNEMFKVSDAQTIGHNGQVVKLTVDGKECQGRKFEGKYYVSSDNFVSDYKEVKGPAPKQQSQTQSSSDSFGKKVGESIANGVASSLGKAAEEALNSALGLKGSSSTSSSSSSSSTASSETQQSSNKRPVIDKETLSEANKERASWKGSVSVGNNTYLGKNKSSLGSVEDVMKKVLSNMGYTDTEANGNQLSSLSADGELRQSVIKANPSIFSGDGKVYDDANWGSLRFPSRSEIKKKYIG